MIWLQFFGIALITVFAAIKLAEYGDVIAIRTRLGGMFIGTMLMAGATSLPELLTAANSINQDVPSLTVGDIFGSCMLNMFVLALLDLFFQQQRILRQVATTHALSAGLASLLLALAVFFVLARIELRIAWIGVDSLLLITTYVLGAWLIQNINTRAGSGIEVPEEQGLPRLRTALIGFALAAAVLVVAAPWLVRSATGIAEIAGLTTGFVGAAMVAVITSLPELVTTFAAARSGAFDMAVGNLFGSNMFNLVILGLADGFYRQGQLLLDVSPDMVLAALLALILTILGGIGNLARIERRIVFMEVDATLIFVVYALGLWLLFSRGVVG